jgi:hypothetical protein
VTLELQPISYPEACAFIRDHHRHHLPPQGWKFGIAVNAPIALDELEGQLCRAWSAETSAHQVGWTDDNPARGQCAVTALIVQDVAGGELMRCMVNGQSHYYNLLPTGDVDYTARQFDRPVDYSRSEPRSRDYVLAHPDTVRRYELLSSRLVLRRVVGVVTVGRPVARMLDNGYTLEVTRCCTDGTPHACSKLYAAAWRATRALGYRRLITYTLAEEPGTSLTAAGWRVVGQTSGGSWSCPSRPRVDLAPLGQKKLWEAQG